MEPLILFVVFAVAILASGFVKRRRSLRRASERVVGATAWAQTHGWKLDLDDPYLAGRWAGTPFGEGQDRQVSDVLRGVRDGYPLVSFTYRWTTRSSSTDSNGNRTSSTTQHWAHVVALDVQPSMPTVELTPQGFGTRVARWFGGQDVEVGWPPFDDAWRVRASDEGYARSILDARATQRLVQPDAIGRSIRVEGRSVLTWTQGPTEIAALDSRIDQVVAFSHALGMVPDQIADAPPAATADTPRPATSEPYDPWGTAVDDGAPDYGTPDYGTPTAR